jgi:hypothetical protein
MDGLTITLPAAVVHALLDAQSPTDLDRAMLDLRREVFSRPAAEEDEWWKDLDPSELPKF